MAERDRGNLGSDIVLYVAVAVYAALILLFVWGLASQNAYRTIAGEERAARYYSDRQSFKCGTVPLLFDPCSPVKPSAEAEAYVSELDLAAQNKMADWAAVMAGLSFLGLLASVVGIYFIRLTLLETRKASEGAEAGARAAYRAASATLDSVSAAREATEQSRAAHFIETRPWIRVYLDGGMQPRFSDTDIIADNGFGFRNLGRTPAVEVRTACRPYSIVGEIDIKQRLRDFAADVLTPQLGLPIDTILVPEGEDTIYPKPTLPIGDWANTRVLDDGEQFTALVIFGVSYKSLYDDRTFVTIRAYIAIIRRNLDGSPWNGAGQGYLSPMPGGALMT